MDVPYYEDTYRKYSDEDLSVSEKNKVATLECEGKKLSLIRKEIATRADKAASKQKVDTALSVLGLTSDDLELIKSYRGTVTAQKFSTLSIQF